MGGLFGLLAVLAFVVLAAVILTRRDPEPAAPALPPSTAAPATTLQAPPSDVPPSTEPAPETGDAVASAPPAEPAVAPPPSGKAPRSPRRAGSTPSGGAGTPAIEPSTGRGPGSQPPSGTAPRRFVLGTTSIESLKPVLRDLKGFEPDSVGVKRAPEVNGRVELEMDPPAVRSGVDYTVKVYLANDGAKDIPVQEMKIETVENGKSASRAFTPRARMVKPKQRVLLTEVAGVWRENARAWAMNVVVTSSRQDVYRNRLRWE